MSYDLFIFAGERSGDLHGEKLLKELYALRPDLKVKGVGGPRMRAVGMESFLPMEEFQVMGFLDVLFSLPSLYKKFRAIKEEILTRRPKQVVTIDYPGFTLRLAQALAKKGSPAERIHYISPTVWAWGKRRIPKIERSFDQLLTILPFEQGIFSKERIQATYVGHPLIARVQRHTYNPNWREEYRIEEGRPLLSLFPGSRKKEIERNFPIQVAAAREIEQVHKDLVIAVSAADESLIPLLQNQGEDLAIVRPNETYELMRSSHLALATSGTVTLELALHHVPTVVTFAIHPVDIFIAQKIFRIALPYFSLPNIICNKELFPELFGPHLTQEALRTRAHEFMVSECLRAQCIEGCKEVEKALGKKDASREAARSIAQSKLSRREVLDYR